MKPSHTIHLSRNISGSTTYNQQLIVPWDCEIYAVLWLLTLGTTGGTLPIWVNGWLQLPGTSVGIYNASSFFGVDDGLISACFFAASSAAVGTSSLNFLDLMAFRIRAGTTLNLNMLHQDSGVATSAGMDMIVRAREI